MIHGKDRTECIVFMPDSVTWKVCDFGSRTGRYHCSFVMVFCQNI